MFRKNIILYLPIFYLMFVANMLYAQDHIIHGVVHTFETVPLIGAEIIVKSTNQSTFTDKQGNFVIFCNSEDKLIVMADGYHNQKVKITEKIKIVAINLKLKTNTKNSTTKNYNAKEQKYAIGYGYVSGQNKTTATESVNTDNASFSRYTNIYELIRGQFAGVQIENNIQTGEKEIIIRGTNSLSSNNSALIVIDGVIANSEILSTLTPIVVKSIHIIKDGSAAIYGSRGANGVLLIETKKGGDEL